MTHSDTLTLLACQIEIPPTPDTTARDRHLARTAAKLRDALAEGPVDLVVLPELAAIDYSREAFDQLDMLAEPLDGPSFETWRTIAVEFATHIAYGFPRRGENGHYISIGVVKPDGTLAGFYDKLHICQYGASMEKDYFIPGDAVFTFDVNGFTCAPLICYDIRFPELTRKQTQECGADVLLHCVANYRDESFASWHHFAVTRAMENQVYLLSINRAGKDWGDSILCPPWMDAQHPTEHLPAAAEAFYRMTLTRDSLEHARAGYTFLEDRLERYDALSHVQG